MSTPSEEVPSEKTPLVTSDSAADNANAEDPEANIVTADFPSIESSNDFDHFVDINDELDRPWPATFERSISLLAGPTMDVDFIEEITKSPKITPNLSQRRKVRKTRKIWQICHTHV